MKLRIRGDSLRLRLTQAEVEGLRTQGAVEEVMHVAPQQSLVYVLRSDATVTDPRVTFQAKAIEVCIPAARAQAWATSEEVSIEATQDCGDDRQLRVLIEKDFKCLTAREGEDDSDAFANPNLSC